MKYLAYFAIGDCTIAVAVWLSEWLGGKIGGIISTAPTVVLVAYVLYCWEQAVGEPASFAWGSVRGLVATGAFMAILGLLPASFSLAPRLAVAGVVWVSVAAVSAFKL